MAETAPETEDTGREPPLEVRRPPAGAPLTPLVFASPHSGRLYPTDMRAAADVDRAALRRSEDAHVDALLGPAPGHGCVVLRARYARAYIDVNREAYELDQAMFADPLPAHARRRTARVAAGLGSIARVAAEGREIYDRKLSLREADARIAAVHAPYHEALTGLIEEARARHGFAVLVDWHSMPSAAVASDPRLRSPPGVVLGDRFGSACAPLVMRTMEALFAGVGLESVRNTPYAGGYTTEAYGRPETGVHAIQVELNRALYLDEATMEPSDGFATLAARLDVLFGRLAQVDWSALARRG